MNDLENNFFRYANIIFLFIPTEFITTYGTAWTTQIPANFTSYTERNFSLNAEILHSMIADVALRSIGRYI